VRTRHVFFVGLANFANRAPMPAWVVVVANHAHA
jgi:hypothetical protein